MANSQKIKTIAQLSRTVQRLKKEGKKIVHCHGVFDLIHPGHIRHLSAAKKEGDRLVVTITADDYVRKGPGRPIFNENLRAEFLASITHVDFVAVNRDFSAVSAIKKIKADYFVKGPDYKNRKTVAEIPYKLNQEEEAVKSVGGKLIFTDDIVFSSSKLINDYLEDYPPKTKAYLDNFKSIYSSESIINLLARLSSLKILIVGDAIIDQYHYCSPMGKSSKEPIIVHKYIREESFIGGALATANHVAALSKNIHLLTVLGKTNSFEDFIKKRMLPQVTSSFYQRESGNTIVKRRFIDKATNQKLFQISIFQDEYIPLRVEKKILNHLRREINKYDLVVVNDFGHGMLTNRLVRFLSSHAKYLALNVQTNSANFGFNIVTKYPKADFVCIDEQELRLATHDKLSPLDKLIKRIYKKMKCSEMVVTRGAEGSISYSGKNIFTETPALTQKIVDRVGAGDALFAVTAPCVYSGMKAELASFIGNIAGALQVQTIGNRRPIELVDMTKFITRLLK